MRRCALITALPALLLAVLPSASLAAISLTFVDSATVHDTLVTLGDIARVHGAVEPLRSKLMTLSVGQAAPPGFARYVDHTEAVRYAVSARYPDLDLLAPEAGRTRVATDSRTLRIDDYRERVLDYLAGAIEWKPGDYRVEIENPDDTWRCHDRPFSVRIEGLEGPKPRGHIRVWLVVSQLGKERRVPVRCRVQVTTPVLVASETIPRGTALSRAVIEKRRMDITGLRYVPLTEFAALEGTRAARSLAPGTVIHERCTEKEPLVRRDEVVYVTVRQGTIRVSVRARARESGALGDHIWVQNLESRALLRVEVCGRGKVKVGTTEAI